MPRALVENPLTGRNEFLYLSDDEHEAYLELIRQDCSHPTTELRERGVAKEGRQHVYQCTVCGLAASRAIKRDDSLILPQWDEYARPKWQGVIASRKRTFLTAVFERQAEEDRRVSHEYEAYLLSDEWRTKRSLVLERDGDLCQGCRQRPATQVHHLTYEHMLDEFLFELVSVCDECHARLHPPAGAL
ncbi:hypothetical protein [Amaricoccus sp.]|uniref:hypothetical protein n=1 Tax=Amaricoccus sp. TaxID=1872485 RepID=UPI001B6A9FBD|nr:hypothetical protein [Amaricoccus sp.]MBP7241777.1 hypothetical protein [Amaricoccus sp.]